MLIRIKGLIRRVLTLALLPFFCLNTSQSQEINDSTVLRWELFREIVRAHHPLALQAQLQVDKAATLVTEAKGNFDPTLNGSARQKYYEGDQYYSYLNGGVTIPTWFGVEASAGYINHEGTYLNPENKLPDSGLFYASVSVPLGKDLFIDKRRAELQKARLYAEAGDYTRQVMINDLIYQAGITYWNYFQAYNRFMILDSAYHLAAERFSAFKQAAELGDRPAIDTLESSIVMQNRWVSRTQAQIEYQTARYELMVFLWLNGNVPIELNESVHPPSHTYVYTNSLSMKAAEIDSLIQASPEMRLYGLKIDVLEVDKRYQLEQFKPSLDLKYEALSAPLNTEPLANYSINNYAWSANFSMPIFLRTERAQLEQNQIAIQETTYEQSLKKEFLTMKANAALFELNQSNDQYLFFLNTVSNYTTMVNAEYSLFNLGESSVFMINSRENDLINAKLKSVELLHKNQKAKLSLALALGNINYIP